MRRITGAIGGRAKAVEAAGERIGGDTGNVEVKCRRCGDLGYTVAGDMQLPCEECGDQVLGWSPEEKALLARWVREGRLQSGADAGG
jgi:hypothetical protein